MRHQLGIALITMAGTVPLLVAPGAPAQERGVTIDPNSPAGREYAIPFAEARNEANPGNRGSGDSGPGGSAAAAPAFGAGISRANAGKAPSRERASTKAPARGTATDGKSAPAGAGQAVTPAAATGNGGGLGRFALIALAVLVFGLVGGLVARRLSANRAG